MRCRRLAVWASHGLVLDGLCAALLPDVIITGTASPPQFLVGGSDDCFGGEPVVQFIVEEQGEVGVGGGHRV